LYLKELWDRGVGEKVTAWGGKNLEGLEGPPGGEHDSLAPLFA
jgi:hypothetical protein